MERRLCLIESFRWVKSFEKSTSLSFLIESFLIVFMESFVFSLSEKFSLVQNQRRVILVRFFFIFVERGVFVLATDDMYRFVLPTDDMYRFVLPTDDMYRLQSPRKTKVMDEMSHRSGQRSNRSPIRIPGSVRIEGSVGIERAISIVWPSTKI